MTPDNSENQPIKKARGKARKLPVEEKRRADGTFAGYRVRIRRAGFQAIDRTFFDPQKTAAQNRTDADKFAADSLAELQLGMRAERGEVDDLTLGAAILRYQAEMAPLRKPKGQADLQRFVNRWCGDALASRKIGELRQGDFGQYRDERLKAGAAAATVKLELAFIRSLFSQGKKEWGWQVTNPISGMRLPKVDNARDRRLEDGEEERLLKACSDMRTPWLLLSVRLALATAARQGEILRLEWTYVDFDKLTAHLKDTKNGESRTIPLSPVAYELLWDARCAAGIELGNDKRIVPIEQMTLVHAFQKACVRAKLANLRFHDLRHEATSRLFERHGFNQAEAMAVTGHKTPSMLARYTHLRAVDLARKLEGS